MINLHNMHKSLVLMKDYFNDISVADIEVPNNVTIGSNEWFTYIFYSCLLDYGMRSKIYHQNLVNTYYKYPYIFDYNNDIDDEELFKIIKNSIHPRYPNVALKKWKELSLFLRKEKNIKDKILDLGSFEQLEKYIRSIKGFGQKTGGLLLRIIYESNICNFDDELSNIPMDRHDIEISYLNNIISKKELNANEIECLSKAWIMEGKKVNIKAHLVDQYLWEIGNSFCNKKVCMNCPLHTNCRGKYEKETV